MTKPAWHLSLFAPHSWHKPFKVWCAANDLTFTDLVLEALRDIAKKKGIKVPS
jgi:hypothetical protein